MVAVCLERLPDKCGNGPKLVIRIHSSWRQAGYGDCDSGGRNLLILRKFLPRDKPFIYATNFAFTTLVPKLIDG